MSRSAPKSKARNLPGGEALSEQTPPDFNKCEGSSRWHVDLSAWLIWAALMLIAIAILPFAARSQDVVRAIARMCGFDLQ